MDFCKVNKRCWGSKQERPRSPPQWTAIKACSPKLEDPEFLICKFKFASTASPFLVTKSCFCASWCALLVITVTFFSKSEPLADF